MENAGGPAVTRSPDVPSDISDSALFTIGHGTHPADDFGALLQNSGIQSLVDIRIGPGSRRNPQFQRAAMEIWLPATGIEYRWERRLGGFRPLPPDSPDTALRNESFRAYAAHMRTADFRAALAELLEQARRLPTVIMCSESVWWRCHRRLVADATVLLHGWSVRHVMPDGRVSEHRPTEGVGVREGDLYYDVTSV
jgi:uncharacterized protein (DUF488 family)